MEYPHNPLGDAVRVYANLKLGQTVGGGECTDLVDEAFRVAGARPGLNYVWGTEIPGPPQWARGKMAMSSNSGTPNSNGRKTALRIRGGSARPAGTQP